MEIWEEKEKKCRRADIFRGIHPPVFAQVGETKELRVKCAYVGEFSLLFRNLVNAPSVPGSPLHTFYASIYAHKELT